jgi:flagellar biosynthesis anti-sigma factor FlgM
MIVNNNETPDVSRLNLEQTSLNKTQGSSPASGVNSAAAASTPGNDSISLSNSPDLVQQALASSSAQRTARTQELQALVQSGQYQPDALDVSSALIDAHLAGA